MLNPPPKIKGPSIPHKPKPKNIEIGLAQLNLAELEDMLATYKVSFANSHLVWLKGVSEIAFRLAFFQLTIMLSILCISKKCTDIFVYKHKY